MVEILIPMRPGTFLPVSRPPTPTPIDLTADWADDIATPPITPMTYLPHVNYPPHNWPPSTHAASVNDHVPGFHIHTIDLTCPESPLTPRAGDLWTPPVVIGIPVIEDEPLTPEDLRIQALRPPCIKRQRHDYLDYQRRNWN